MISQRYKLYLLAFVIYTTSAVVIGALELLAFRYSESATLARLVAMYSGSFLGGFALVLGILRDDRVEKERQRAEKAEESAKQAEQKASQAQQQANQAQQQASQAQQDSEQLRQQFRQQAEQLQQEAEVERRRADRAEAELERLRSEQRWEARFRRLEQALGLTPEFEDKNNDPPEI